VCFPGKRYNISILLIYLFSKQDSTYHSIPQTKKKIQHTTSQKDYNKMFYVNWAGKKEAIPFHSSGEFLGPSKTQAMQFEKEDHKYSFKIVSLCCICFCLS